MIDRDIPLRHLVDIRISNVDKKFHKRERPVRLVNYTDVYYGDRITPELELMRASASADQVRNCALESGDVLITKDSESPSDIGVPAFVEHATDEMVCGYHLAILRPKHDRIDGRYLYWVMNTHSMRNKMEYAATGVTRFGLRKDAISPLTINVPAFVDQRSIASYLDSKTVRFDAIIAKKRHLIDLLQQRVDSTVFAGIRGRLTSEYATYIPSGIEWLGAIPEHYTLPWIGAYYTTQLGKMLSEQATVGPEQYDYIKNVNVLWDELALNDLPTMTFDAGERRRCELRNGDLLVCEGGEAGRSAIWQHGGDIYFQKAIHRVRPRTQGVPRFLMYCLWAAARQRVFVVEGNQSTIVHLTGEKLRAHRVPWPPMEEQERVVSLIDAERQQVNSAILALTTQIELLNRRRQALISAVIADNIICS